MVCNKAFYIENLTFRKVKKRRKRIAKERKNIQGISSRLVHTIIFIHILIKSNRFPWMLISLEEI